MMHIVLATEDDLSEAFGLRLISEITPDGANHVECLKKNGFGYLRSGMDKWRKIARIKNRVILVLTDLDQKECPMSLLNDWGVNKKTDPQNLILRIAVHEAEAWVLADHAGVRKLIKGKGTLPPNPDNLPEPRNHFLKLVKQYAPRDIQKELLPEKNAIASKGIHYNSKLVEWIREVWNPGNAATRSPSLQRARAALKNSALGRGPVP